MSGAGCCSSDENSKYCLTVSQVVGVQRNLNCRGPGNSGKNFSEGGGGGIILHTVIQVLWAFRLKMEKVHFTQNVYELR